MKHLIEPLSTPFAMQNFKRIFIGLSTKKESKNSWEQIGSVGSEYTITVILLLNMIGESIHEMKNNVVPLAIALRPQRRMKKTVTKILIEDGFY